jgi:nitroreductase
MVLRKPAITSRPVNELIRQRWSPRSFTDRAVDHDTLVALFEAARWAASCNNLQPWRYIIATKNDQEAWEVAQNCTLDRNQRWTRLAPVIGYVMAEPVPLPGDRANLWHQFDAGMASAQLTIEAESRGLVVHQFAGIDYDAVRETYEVPSHVDIICGIVLGYQGDPEVLIEDLPGREREERKRNPLSDFVFQGRYGRASPDFNWD